MSADPGSTQGPSDTGNTKPLNQAGRGKTAGLVLRILAAAALAVDAAVHAQLAPGYQSAAPEGFGEGNLFLAEAAAAAAAGLYVLIRGSRPAWILTLLTAGGGLAVLKTRTSTMGLSCAVPLSPKLVIRTLPSAGQARA